MARETDYTILYRAAADFSALTREAAKAKAIIKAMREEEEKANKSILQDQDRIEKARVRARKALEAQNIAATTSARISREMHERGKREAETSRELARNSEMAARQINKLAEAYKKLNAAASGDSTSTSSRNIGEKTSFANVSARDLDKVRNNLNAYRNSAQDTSDTNTRLRNSFRNVGDGANSTDDILARLTRNTRKHNESVTEVTVSTRNYGNVVETTTRRVQNAGTEAEKIITTIRRVTNEHDRSSRGFFGWAGSVGASFRRVFREAEQGVSVFGKLRRAISDSNQGGSSLDRLRNAAKGLSDMGTKAIAVFSYLPRVLQLAIGIATIFEPAVAILGALSVAALGAANNIAALGGVLAAVPGFIAAAGTAVAAFLVVLAPVKGVLQQFAKAQLEQQTQADKSAKSHKDNSAAIRSAASAVRNSANSLKSAQDGVAEADRRVEDAHRRLIDANKDLKKAQEDVGKAAQAAKRDLEDLREEAADGARSEERAQINLARAKERLAEVNKNLKSSDLDRAEALLDVKDAEDELNDVRRENGRTKEDLVEAEKKGIKNSDQVVAANERLVKAQQAVIDAQRGVQDAQTGLAAAHRRVADAELDLADARARLAEAGKTEASTTAATTTQQDRYRHMLEQLGPATRKVVSQLLDLRTAWKSVQRDTSESFFSRIVGDMGKVRGFLPTVRNLLLSAADAMGQVADKGIRMVTSGPWKDDFAKLSKDNTVLIRNMGDAGLSVLDAFRNITMAAAPFTKWVSGALKEGAANFAAWAKQARNTGSIARFLEDTKARMQQMWQITKNILATLSSWNTTSNDFGKWILDRLEAMTKRWRDVAKAQEQAGSPLRKYFEEVKPVLTATASLIGAIVRGLAQMSADPQNMSSTVKLLTALEKDVLPPLLKFLDQINDSGIALTVADALGRIFEALDQFLEAGGGQAITSFVSAFAGFVSGVLAIVDASGAAPVLGGIAKGLATIFGILVGAKFLGLFKLIEGFKWIRDNGRKVAAGFRDIGGAVNDTTTTTNVVRPRPGGGSGPGTSIGLASRISNDELAAVQRNVRDFSREADIATRRGGFFARALDGVRNAAGGARRGIGGFVDFLGGPYGAALAAATIALTIWASKQADQKQKIDEYAAALKSVTDGYSGVAGGAQKLDAQSLQTNPKLAEMVNLMKDAGLSADEIKGAFEGAGEGVEAASGKIDKAIETMRQKMGLSTIDFPIVGKQQPSLLDRLFNKDDTEKLKKLEQLKKALDENKISATDAARAMEILGIKQEHVAETAQVYADKTHAANFEQSAASEKAQAMAGVLDTLSSSTSTTAQRFEALKTATDLLYGDQQRATDSVDNFNRRLLEMSDTLKANEGSLNDHSLAGLNNKDALKAAARAVADDTLQLIASGVPYDVAIKKHNDRIKALKEEADKQVKNKDKAHALIDEYGKIPPAKTTDVKLTGFDKVYQGLRELQWAQLALKYGYSPEEAAAAWKRMEAARKGQYPQGGGNAGLSPNTQKKAGGGAVYGPGSKTSDDIEARLSNGEFVHKADAVGYYGTDLMYALNNQLIDKRTLKAAAQISAVKGGPLDFEYADGGLIKKYASGGEVDNFPVSLNGVVAQGKKLFNTWKSGYVASQTDGGSVSTGGMRTGILSILGALREHFGKVPLISGFRKGSRTLSGNLSYHASGRAFDIAPIRAWGEWLHDMFGGRLKELITPWRDLNMWNGKPHRYSKAVEAQHGVYGNNAHIHAAYANGGLVEDLNRMMGFGGFSLPGLSVPRTSTSNLSAAAKAITNGSSGGGMNFGDIIIHNPIAERGGDSIRKSVMRTAFLFDES